MNSKTVEEFVKYSIVYGYVVTQPFLFNIHSAESLQENKSHELYKDNSKIERYIQHQANTDDKKPHFIYHLPKEQVKKGVQSSQQIKVTGRANIDKMKQNINEDKSADFKQLQSEIQTIEYGEQSKIVKKVQEILASHGYYEGNVDSIYGPLTEKALHQAKQDHVLPIQPSTDKEPSISTDGSTEKDNHDDIEQANETVQLEVHNPGGIIQEAKQFIGTPYVWGGTSPAGFDCSGFIQYVYNEKGRTLPRTVREIWNHGTQTDSPSIGDLIFFETYQSGPSHMGIYLGNGDFIHAGSSTGVTISNYSNDSYWKERYIGAKTIN